MLVFQIVAYVAFGFLCISWIISGVKKLNNTRNIHYISIKFASLRNRNGAFFML